MFENQEMIVSFSKLTIDSEESKCDAMTATQDKQDCYQEITIFIYIACEDDLILLWFY